MDQRLHILHQWLKQTCQSTQYQLVPVAGGASFRRYFRMLLDGKSYIVMDSPPEIENVISFVAIDKAFSKLGVRVPTIFHQDLQLGFLLLEDFGDALYCQVLNDMNADKLYEQALDVIVTIQSCQQVNGWDLPCLDYNFMLSELHEFVDWYLIRHLKYSLSDEEQTLLNRTFHFIVKTAADQQQVCIHRDYHSQNLMCLANNETGIIDFQSAMIGPITYDLVSLIKDCYIAWPNEKVKHWICMFQEKLLAVGAVVPVDKQAFVRDAEIMGVQRHLKAILTFARKFHRDNDDSYLQFIPIALNYINSIVTQYSELISLGELLQRDKEVKEI